jgi:hypothetical protein
MPTNKNYRAKADLVQLQNDLREVFERHRFAVTSTSDATNLTIILQSHKSILSLPVSLADVTGTSCAVSAKITILNTGTDVSVYDQKWVQPILAILVICVVVGIWTLASMGAIDPSSAICCPCSLWLLVFIPIYALFEQYRITNTVWSAIEMHMANIALG